MIWFTNCSFSVYYLHSDGVFDGGGGNFTAYVSQDVGTFENVV
jgi:hypothetical protein